MNVSVFLDGTVSRMEAWFGGIWGIPQFQLLLLSFIQIQVCDLIFEDTMHSYFVEKLFESGVW